MRKGLILGIVFGAAVGYGFAHTETPPPESVQKVEAAEAQEEKTSQEKRDIGVYRSQFTPSDHRAGEGATYSVYAESDAVQPQQQAVIQRNISADRKTAAEAAREEIKAYVEMEEAKAKIFRMQRSPIYIDYGQFQDECWGDSGVIVTRAMKGQQGKSETGTAPKKSSFMLVSTTEE